jgi:DnaJ-class molecular chaperone
MLNTFHYLTTTLAWPFTLAPETHLLMLWGLSMQIAREKPVAECTKCSVMTRQRDQINNSCYQWYDGQRCPGILERRLRVLDWAICLECNGFGVVEQKPCSHCNSNGWIKGRRIRTNKE